MQLQPRRRNRTPTETSSKEGDRRLSGSRNRSNPKAAFFSGGQSWGERFCGFYLGRHWALIGFGYLRFGSWTAKQKQETNFLSLLFGPSPTAGGSSRGGDRTRLSDEIGAKVGNGRSLTRCTTGKNYEPVFSLFQFEDSSPRFRTEKYRTQNLAKNWSRGAQGWQEKTALLFLTSPPLSPSDLESKLRSSFLLSTKSFWASGGSWRYPCLGEAVTF